MGPRMSVLQPLWPCNFKGFSHHVPQHTLLTPEPSTLIPDHPFYARMKMRKEGQVRKREAVSFAVAFYRNISQAALRFSFQMEVR